MEKMESFNSVNMNLNPWVVEILRQPINNNKFKEMTKFKEWKSENETGMPKRSINLSGQELAYLIDSLSVINERFYKVEIAVEKLDAVSQTKFAELIDKQKEAEHEIVLSILAKLSDTI